MHEYKLGAIYTGKPYKSLKLVTTHSSIRFTSLSEICDERAWFINKITFSSVLMNFLKVQIFLVILSYKLKY